MQEFNKGFRPGAQRLADGGMVKDKPSLINRIASVFSPAVAQRKSRLDQAEAQALGFRPQAPSQPVTQQAEQAPEPKPFRFADGGMIKGPGTGTSDSIAKKVPVGSFIMPSDSTAAIGEKNLGGMGFKPSRKMPVRVSNGEYELPPEQVHAIGVSVLDHMRDTTHTPAAGFKPQHFFADGGEVVEEGLRRQITSPANPNFQAGPSPEARAYQGEQAARMGAPASTAAQSGGISTQIGGIKQGISEAKGAWESAGTMGKTKMAAGTAVKGLGRAAGAYQVGDALASGGDDLGALYASDTGIGNKIAGTAEVAGNVASNVAANFAKRAPIVGPMIGSAIGDRPATQLSRMFNDESAIDRARADVGADPIAPRGMPQFAGANAAKLPTQSRPTANPKLDTTANPLQQAGSQPQSGISATAQTQASTQLNDQNALNGVVGRTVKDAPGIVKLQGGMFGENPMYTDDPVRAANEFNQVQIAPTSAGVKAGGGAASNAPAGNGIGVPGGFGAGGGSTSAALSAARAAAAERGDFEALRRSYQTGGGTWQGETAFDTDIGNARQELMGAPTAKKRAALTQQLNALQNQQFGMLDAEAKAFQNRIAGGEFQLKSTAQGFQARAAQRLENLQNQYQAAKTPREREAIALQLRQLQGKEESAEWGVQVTPKTKDAMGNETEGSVFRYNKRTGQVERVDSGQPAQAAQAAHADARAAMAKGMSKDEVNKRLAAAGYPTI